MSKAPVLFIGLDGVDFRYLDAFQEDLDHINRIREDGIEIPLNSVHPPWTGSAWPSMYTGLDPSRHGVYDFFDYNDVSPDNAEVVTRNSVRAPAIWNYLTELDLQNIVLNMPITHPAEELNGVLVPGYLASKDEDGYPSGIREEISDALGHSYNIYSEYETSEPSSKKIDGYDKLIRERADTAVHLLESKPWDFALIQVQKTDAVFHNSSSKEDFRRIYRAADDLVGRITEVCPPDTNIILCSDHGIGPVTGYTVYVNQLLKNHSFVKGTSGQTSPSLTEVKEGTESSNEPDQSREFFERFSGLIQKSRLNPAAIYRIAQKIGIGDQVIEVLPDNIKNSLTRGVDWRESAAYCRSGSEQGIRINVKDRDPDGVVAQNEYENIRSEIIELLMELKTPEGDPVFEYVHRREEIYDGPYCKNACDVLFRTTDMNHMVSPKLYGEVFVPTDSYNHKDTGIFVASGPDINSSWTGDSLSLLDVAPIVFGLLNQPVPEQMVGSVPDGLVTTPVTRTVFDNVSFGTDVSYSQDQDEVTDRLQDLGYL